MTGFRCLECHGVYWSDDDEDHGCTKPDCVQRRALRMLTEDIRTLVKSIEKLVARVTKQE